MSVHGRGRSWHVSWRVTVSQRGAQGPGYGLSERARHKAPTPRLRGRRGRKVPEPERGRLQLY